MRIMSRSSRLRAGCLALPLCGIAAVNTPAVAAGDGANVLIVVGPSNHAPGTHEVAAGGRLLAHGLASAPNVSALAPTVVYAWPEDPAVLAKADTVVMLGDQFPGERMQDADRVMKDLAGMMARGCGLVCIHYATGLGNQDMGPDGKHPLLDWTGGYFATQCDHHQSVARVWDSTIEPAGNTHPINRGWSTFSFRDEPYIKNYFGPGGLAKNVAAIAVSMLPPDAPNEEVVAWAVTREDGGRGMGVVMPHFYRNWREDGLRTMILNAIVWTAGRDVPAEGVQSDPPDLTAFEPEAVEP